MQPLFIIRYFLNSENAMFTASELLERINSHIAELQFVRTPQGLYAPVTYVLSMGGKESVRFDVDGLQFVSGGYYSYFKSCNGD